MKLIEEIEISYYRSFYKIRLHNLSDLNIIFGKNDSGKSNIVRALNLFFNGRPDLTQTFEFPIDFCEERMKESEKSEDVRKFLYVKITINTPPSYQPSLGNQFYVKRQWTVSRGQDYIEEFPIHIPNNKRHIVTRLLNKIKFMYIPAIKDIHIFEKLLNDIYETLASSSPLESAVKEFSDRIQEFTGEMFDSLPDEVSSKTKIGAPKQLFQLFQTLDFETTISGETNTKSLTRQRGDGIKARHIPELLSFISKNDKYDYHIWGFEEPENSLDFVAAQSEAARFLGLSKSNNIQIFMTTHSPSFYLLEDKSVTRFYVRKDNEGSSSVLQGKELNNFDIEQALGEGFYLPAVAESLKELTEYQNRVKIAESRINDLKEELQEVTTPVLLTEGRTDAKILLTAWEKIRGGDPPFRIRSCETGAESAASGNGGAQSLAVRLKGVAADHPHAVIGIFDYDEEGIKAYKLDNNFKEIQISGHKVKRGLGRSYAFLLPCPDFRKKCYEYNNMPIEFLFRDEDIFKNINGKKLILEPLKFSRNMAGKKIERVFDDFIYFKHISSGKTDFAEQIITTFDVNSFHAFKTVFELIEGIIKHHNHEN